MISLKGIYTIPASSSEKKLSLHVTIRATGLEKNTKALVQLLRPDHIVKSSAALIPKEALYSFPVRMAVNTLDNFQIICKQSTRPLDRSVG